MVEEAGWIEDLLGDEDFATGESAGEIARAVHQIRTQGERCKEITHKLLSFARKTDPTARALDLNDLVDEVVEPDGSEDPLRQRQDRDHADARPAPGPRVAVGAAAGAAQPGQQRDRRDRSRRGRRWRRHRPRRGPAWSCCASATPARESPRPTWSGSSTRSSPPSRSARAPASVCRSATASSTSSAGGSRSKARSESAPPSASTCRPASRASRPETAAAPDEHAGTQRRDTMMELSVLLVDDEVAFVEALARRLGKRGFRVATATSGPQALEVLAEGGATRTDVVILDVKMPGMDGLETLAAIKERHPLVEVIMLTGHATVESAIEGMKRGAFDYLMKPCDMDDPDRQARAGRTEKARPRGQDPRGAGHPDRASPGRLNGGGRPASDPAAAGGRRGRLPRGPEQAAPPQEVRRDHGPLRLPRRSARSAIATSTSRSST